MSTATTEHFNDAIRSPAGLGVSITSTAVRVHVRMDYKGKIAERFVTWYEIEDDPEAIVKASNECYTELGVE